MSYILLYLSVVVVCSELLPLCRGVAIDRLQDSDALVTVFDLLVQIEFERVGGHDFVAAACCIGQRRNADVVGISHCEGLQMHTQHHHYSISGAIGQASPELPIVCGTEAVIDLSDAQCSL